MIKDELNFEFVDDFVDAILDRIYADEDLCISIVAKFGYMKEVIKAVMLFADDVNFENIKITDPLLNDYNDEYVLDISTDKEGSVFFSVEPAKRDDKYLDVSNDEVYIFEDCNAKVVDHCDEYSDTYIVHIGEEDEFEEEPENEGGEKAEKAEREECICPECKAKRDLSKTDKTDKTEYRVNGKEVSKAEYDKAYKDFHAEYDKVFEKLLRSHCKFMDEVNNAFAQFRMW